MQIGDESPDVDIGAVGAAFNVTQRLLEDRRISAGHDVSDGGLAVALLEMAFAGNVGITADVSAPADSGGPLAALFAEELGLLLEVGATRCIIGQMLLPHANLSVCNEPTPEAASQKRDTQSLTCCRMQFQSQVTLGPSFVRTLQSRLSEVVAALLYRLIQRMSRALRTHTGQLVSLWRQWAPWQTAVTSASQSALHSKSQVHAQLRNTTFSSVDLASVTSKRAPRLLLP